MHTPYTLERVGGRGRVNLLEVDPLCDTGLAVPVAAVGDGGPADATHAYDTLEVLDDGRDLGGTYANDRINTYGDIKERGPDTCLYSVFL